jgi:hypothetical protein
MRRAFPIASVGLALAAAAACATSNDDPSLLPTNDAGAIGLPDAPSTDTSVPVQDAFVPNPSFCSEAGWCATSLPDTDLTLRDIWPFASRAFAIAESATLGTKVLEWTDESASWKYIDDNTQNAYGSGSYAGKIWAPNENEIYYAVAPSLIYHGTRTTTSAPWSWQSTRLPYKGRDLGVGRDPGLGTYGRFGPDQQHSYAAIGVWGTSGGDVYAWYANAIFHWKSEDGGAPEWVAEYVADDSENPGDPFFFFGASGSSADDIWFAGGRGRYDGARMFACPMAVQRRPDGYHRIVDYTIDPSGDPGSHYASTCQARDGALQFFVRFEIPGFGTFVLPWTNGGWLTNIESARPGGAIAILERRNVAYVGWEDAGVAILNPVGVQSASSAFDPLLSSIWIHGQDAWISGWGLVLKAENKPQAWSEGKGIVTPEELIKAQIDGGTTYSISTTALNGAPLDRPLHQVRGTSSSNLWVVGPRYALHKTTP